MISEENSPANLRLYYRIIALWVIVEGIAGGIMHGLRVPFTGMLVSGGAVICISLLGYYFPEKNAILKAMMVVVFFKLMIAPHSPITAYFAIFFQATIGQFLFYFLKSYELSCLILGVVALIESSIQRVIILVIIYGNNFLKAFNSFIHNLLKTENIDNYALWLILLYFTLHAVAGVAVGFLAIRMIRLIRSSPEERKQYELPAEFFDSDKIVTPKKSRRGSFKILLFVIWIILILLYFQSILHIGKPILPSGSLLHIIFRSTLIILSWFFIVAPLIKMWLKNKMEKEKGRLSTEIERVMQLLPSTEKVLRGSWKYSEKEKGFARLKLFWKVLLINQLAK